MAKQAALLGEIRYEAGVGIIIPSDSYQVRQMLADLFRAVNLNGTTTVEAKGTVRRRTVKRKKSTRAKRNVPRKMVGKRMGRPPKAAQKIKRKATPEAIEARRRGLIRARRILAEKRAAAAQGNGQQALATPEPEPRPEFEPVEA